MQSCRSQVFDEWDKGELESYLIQITRDILAFNDESGTPLLEKIRDVSGQVKHSSSQLSRDYSSYFYKSCKYLAFSLT